MRTRILPPEEWTRLRSPGVPELIRYVEPQNIAVIAVENEQGEIVASVFVLKVSHFEGLWIDPQHRGNAGVFRPLIRQAFSIPRVRGESFVFAGAENGDSKMDSICRRLGGRPLNVRSYALPVGG